MAKCSKCGARGHGITGHVLTRECVICGNTGCDSCMSLIFVTTSTPVKSHASDKVHGYNQKGCCSNQCYETYWRKWVGQNPHTINKIPFLPIYEKQFYAAHMCRLAATKRAPGPEDIMWMSKFIEFPLAQGLTMMHNSYQALEFEGITDGLRIARNDPVYTQYLKRWVDDLAESYIRELKRFDVPTRSANIGGVQISLAVPKGQNQMRLNSCPSCGAQLDIIAVRGQTVKCSFCSSTFQVG